MTPDESKGKAPTQGRAARTARLGRVAAGGAARWAGDRLDSRGTDDERQRRRGDRVVATIDSLVDQLAVMRGAAMKAGQVLSTVEFPGLDPDQAEYLQQRLASLRDNVPAVGWKQMREVLEREWGEPPETGARRASIPSRPPPRASARSTAGARTTASEVAVKVQYPGIAEAVESDMRNLRMLSPVLRRLMPGLDVKDVLAELAERITEECDYELEAANHRRLARFWRDHPFIRVPAVDTRAQPPPRARHRVGRRRRASSEVAARARRRSATASPRSSTASSTRTAAAARPRARRPAPGQLPALRRRPRRLLRLRDGPRPAARVPAPRGAGLRRDPRRRRRRPARQAMRELGYLPGLVGRVGRSAAARAHARRAAGGSRRPAAAARARGPVARHRVAARRERRARRSSRCAA